MTYTLLVSHEPADFHWLSEDRLTQAEIIPDTSPWPCRFLCLSKKLGATNKITEPCLSLCCSNFKHNKGSGSCHHVFLLMRGLGLGMMRLKEVLNYTGNMHASLMTTKSTKLSEEENRRLYGKCYHPNGHGHNYTGKLLNNQVTPFC